jgi:DNA-binding transcriptional ArsR family regulator
MNAGDPEYVFDALGDPTRRRVVVQLGSLGSATPTQLAQYLPITRQAISKHLDMLADAGLVAFERHGRETIYRLTPERFTDAVGWIVQVGAEWDTRLAALRRQFRSK